jgi:hypothetical protein
MSRRFNFTQCITMLHTNSKTFLKWLAEDGIDASKQRDPADPRQKYVTEEQLTSIAKKREIELHLPDPDRKPESSATRILAAVNERFAALEQEMAHRFDQMEAQLSVFMIDVRHELEQPGQQPTRHFDQLDARLKELLVELQRIRASTPSQERPTALAPRARIAPTASASTPSTTTPAPPKPTAKKRSKRKTRARKDLPGTLTPLAIFRQTHGISEKAVENAIQRNKLAVVRGAWLYQHRSISVALDRQGQQQFHALFYQREGYQRCVQCPHAL